VASVFLLGIAALFAALLALELTMVLYERRRSVSQAA
jgi:hypothetical protein